MEQPNSDVTSNLEYVEETQFQQIQQILRPSLTILMGNFYPKKALTPDQVHSLKESIRETIALQLDIPEESIAITFIV